MSLDKHVRKFSGMRANRYASGTKGFRRAKFDQAGVGTQQIDLLYILDEFYRITHARAFIGWHECASTFAETARGTGIHGIHQVYTRPFYFLRLPDPREEKRI